MTPTVTETETDARTAMSEDSVGQRASSRTATEAPRPAARADRSPEQAEHDGLDEELLEGS